MKECFSKTRSLRQVGFIAVVLLLMSGQLAGYAWDADIVRYVPTREKVVALTYDDGPHPTFTPELLKILDKYNVKATFFMIGSRMEAYPDIVRAAASKGHTIANHTYTHPLDMKKLPSVQVIWELSMCEQVITRLTGQHAELFRPPRGFIDSSVLRIANIKGYKTILWSVCANNKNAPTPALMAQRVLSAVRPGAIVLAHDGTFGTRWKDVAATSIIIESLKKQGYRFVTIPELLRLRSYEDASSQIPMFLKCSQFPG